MVIVPNWSAEALFALFENLSGQVQSFIQICAYCGIRDMVQEDKITLMGYTHFTVNHFQNFKDPITGAHSNGIAGTVTMQKKFA
jgi:hypothetical protein